MTSEKATYWMAVGVLVLAVGNHFATKLDGKFLADRTVAAVQRLSSQADHAVAMAEFMLGRTAMPVVQAQVSIARVQARLASVQTVMARQEAACARLQGERARMLALEELQRVRVVCPRQTVRVEIPRIEVPQAPVIHNDGTI